MHQSYRKERKNNSANKLQQTPDSHPFDTILLRTFTNLRQNKDLSPIFIRAYQGLIILYHMKEILLEKIDGWPPGEQAHLLYWRL